MPSGFFLNGLRGFSEKGVLQIGNEHAEYLRLPPREIARVQVRTVTELRNGAPNAISREITDTPFFIEHC